MPYVIFRTEHPSSLAYNLIQDRLDDHESLVTAFKFGLQNWDEIGDSLTPKRRGHAVKSMLAKGGRPIRETLVVLFDKYFADVDLAER